MTKRIGKPGRVPMKYWRNSPNTSKILSICPNAATSDIFKPKEATHLRITGKCQGFLDDPRIGPRCRGCSPRSFQLPAMLSAIEVVLIRYAHALECPQTIFDALELCLIGTSL